MIQKPVHKAVIAERESDSGQKLSIDYSLKNEEKGSLREGWWIVSIHRCVDVPPIVKKGLKDIDRSTAGCFEKVFFLHRRTLPQKVFDSQVIVSDDCIV